MRRGIQVDKQRISTLLLWLTTLGQASIALYLPSLPIIAHDLAVSPIIIKQTITMFIIGFGISPIFYGPLSDLYGRKPILLFSLSIACIGYLVNMLASTIEIFSLARLIQGIGCGGVLIGGRSIMRDIFSGRELASTMSYLSMGFAIGFGISPTIGVTLSNYVSWRANFAFLFVAGLAIFISVLYLLPETISSKQDKIPLHKFLRKTLNDYQLILSNRIFIQYVLSGLLAYAVISAYNVMTPFLMQSVFAISATKYAYMAILLGIPYYLAAYINRKLVLKLGVALVCTLGYALIIVAGVVMLGLFLATQKLQLIALIAPMMLATFGQAFVFSNTISGALQQFPAKQGGRASALFSGIQMSAVSVLSAIMAVLPNNPLYLAIVITVLGICAAIAMPREKH